MNTARTDALGQLLLRLTLGGLMLVHGLWKVFNGADGIYRMVDAAGLPTAIGHLVYVGEVLAPVLVLLGLFTRPAALVIAFHMVVALLLAHTSQFFTLTKSGGWALELQAFFLLSALVIALQGAGPLRVGKPATRWWQ